MTTDAAGMLRVRQRVKRLVRTRVPLIGSVTAVGHSAGGVVLTFDDGPDPRGTRAVLAALERNGATATFFVLNSRARHHRGILAEIVAAGHEIGLHGPDHRDISRMPLAEVYRRTKEARAELEDLVGLPIRWFRPPYGHQSFASFVGVRRAGLHPVLWTGTALDGRHASSAERLASALRVAESGSILLAHDGRANREDGVDDDEIPAIDRGELVQRILRAYAARGLRGLSLARALEDAPALRGYWFAR